MGNVESQDGGYKRRGPPKEWGGAGASDRGGRDHHAWSDEESGVVTSPAGRWVGAEAGFTHSGRNLKSVRSHPDEAFTGSQRSTGVTEGADHDGPSDKKRHSIASSLRKFVSGRLRRGRDGLPTCVQDLSTTGNSLADESSCPGGVSVAASTTKRGKKMNMRQQRVTASPGRQGALSKDEVAQMCKYMGIDLKTKEGRAFKWLAEEALGAQLPPGWEEHKTEEGVPYYFNTVGIYPTISHARASPSSPCA